MKTLIMFLVLLLAVVVTIVNCTSNERDPKLRKWLKYCSNLPANTNDPVCCHFFGTGCQTSRNGSNRQVQAAQKNNRPVKPTSVEIVLPNEESRPVAGRWRLKMNGNSRTYEQQRVNPSSSYQSESIGYERSEHSDYPNIGAHLQIDNGNIKKQRKSYRDSNRPNGRFKHSFGQAEPNLYYQYSTDENEPEAKPADLIINDIVAGISNLRTDIKPSATYSSEAAGYEYVPEQDENQVNQIEKHQYHQQKQQQQPADNEETETSTSSFSEQHENPSAQQIVPDINIEGYQSDYSLSEPNQNQGFEALPQFFNQPQLNNWNFQ